MSSIQYRPETDGLRALAIIPVILFHMQVPWLAGGYIGVDVFFVISGYLISMIIHRDYEAGHFNILNFWFRRISRILPALLTMVIVTSIVSFFVLYAPSLNALGSSALAATLSYSNIEIWLNTGSYWGGDARDAMLLHTWSLSVEEQFYLFFPFILIVVLKYIREKEKLIFSLLTLLSFCLFLYGVQSRPSATFYLLPTRWWELSVGCLLGLLTYRRAIPFQGSLLLSMVGISTIVLSYIFFSEGGISTYLILPVLGTALVLAFSQDKNNFVHKFLSKGLLVAIGKISYSLYLWHWPVLVLASEMFPMADSTIIALVSTPIILVLSIASYVLIEKKVRYHPKRIFVILPAFVFCILISVFLMKSSLVEDMKSYSETVWDGAQYNIVPNQKQTAAAKKKLEGITAPQPISHNPGAYLEGGIINLYGEKTPEIVVFGDSHALMWSGVLDEVAREQGLSISFYAANGTPTFFNVPVSDSNKKKTTFFSPQEKYNFDERRVFFLNKWKPKLVIFSSFWGVQNAKDMRSLLEYIESIGSKVLFFEDPPFLYFGDKNTPQYLARSGIVGSLFRKQYISSLDSIKYNQGRDLLRAVSSQYKHCSYTPLADIFLEGEDVWVLDGRDVLYIDDDHLSHAGALKAKEIIEQELERYFPNI